MTAPEQQYYELVNVYEDHHLETSFEQNRFRMCIDAIPSAAKSLLDVGTGRGHFLAALEVQRQELELHGVERSAACISRPACKTTILQSSIDLLPIDTKSVDVVTVLEVLEHLPFGVYERGLRELERVAREYILINVPYRERRLRAICPYCASEFSPHFHMRSFDEPVLNTLFSSFRLEKMSLVTDKESVLRMVVRPFRQHVFGGFPNTLCPVCGFSDTKEPGEKAQRTQGKTGQILRWVDRVLPKVSVDREVIALYRRQ